MGIDSLCESFEGKIKDQIRKLRKSKGQLRNKINELDDAIEGVIDETGIPEIDDKIMNKTDEIYGQFDSYMDEVSKYTGSCLDGIQRSVNEVKNNVNNTVGDMFNVDDSPNWQNISSTLGSTNNIVNKLGLSSLIKGLDESLGCLAEENCFIDGLDDMISEINSFIFEFSLDDTGNFNIDNFLGDKELNMDVKQNISKINNSIKNVGKETKELIKSKGKTKIPFEVW